jgi:hypothetical protein
MRLVSLPSIEGVIEELPTDPVADELFAHALRDNSNPELERLLLTNKVRTDSHRVCCQRLALGVNPHSALARRGLAVLRRRLGLPAWIVIGSSQSREDMRLPSISGAALI